MLGTWNTKGKLTRKTLIVYNTVLGKIGLGELMLGDIVKIVYFDEESATDYCQIRSGGNVNMEAMAATAKPRESRARLERVSVPGSQA